MADFEQQPLFLTVAEALAQGYTKCGDENRDFQICMEITDVTTTEHQWCNLVLCEKEPIYRSVTDEIVRDIIIDQVYADDQFDDDTEDTSDDLKKHVDWKRIADEINEALKKKPYWNFTSIRLIP